MSETTAPAFNPASIGVNTGPPPAKTIGVGILGALFGSAVARWSLQANGVCNGTSGGFLGYKSKPCQWLDNERAAMAKMNADGHALLAQAAAAAAPVAHAIQQVHNMSEVFGQIEHGLGRSFANIISHEIG